MFRYCDARDDTGLISLAVEAGTWAAAASLVDGTFSDDGGGDGGTG